MATCNEREQGVRQSRGPHGQQQRYRASAAAPSRIVALAAAMLALSAFSHDPLDTPVNWYHQAEGGEIAKLRPPPPGNADSYPHVGLTPTRAPDLPSASLRADLTEQLIEQRNYARLMDAKSGPLVVVPTVAAKPAAPRPTAVQPEGAAGSNATFDAVNMDPQPAAGSTGPAPAPAPAKPAPKVSAAPAPAAGETAMPALDTSVTQPSAAANAPPPTMPDLPPPAPQFPGFDVPTDGMIADTTRPAYALGEPAGTLVLFEPGTDAIAEKQEKTISSLVSDGVTKVLSIHGYGAAQGTDAADQTRAIQLGLLRAQALSDALVKRGVPLSHIRMDADAFGHDARVTF